MKKSELDPILQDIQEAVKGGYFDDWQPSELSVTGVEELLGQVGMMSDARRRKHLELIGNQGGGGDAQPPGVFGLPADDQIRFDEDVGLLRDDALGEKLDDVIQSWPVWRRRTTSALERVKGWLSKDGPAAAKQQGKWLSR